MSTDKKVAPHLSKYFVSSIKKIGRGCFGKVYKGILRRTDGKSITIVIKELKNNAHSEVKEDFIREIEIMSNSRHHNNILKLIGIFPQDRDVPMMAFECMTYGNLTEVLRNGNEEFKKYNLNLPILDKDKLLFISLQISAGMKFLASHGFIHRDLACRNCQVGNELKVKISNFGMSRDLYKRDYYKVAGPRLRPVRWLPPESSLFGEFTLETDVWSFGIILWEIYSFGERPYRGYSDEEVLIFIQNRILLEKPLNCPLEISEIMEECWKINPKERLNFVDIHKRLKISLNNQKMN